jgi:hypothetical protein
VTRIVALIIALSAFVVWLAGRPEEARSTPIEAAVPTERSSAPLPVRELGVEPPSSPSPFATETFMHEVDAGEIEEEQFLRAP